MSPADRDRGDLRRPRRGRGGGHAKSTRRSEPHGQCTGSAARCGIPLPDPAGGRNQLSTTTPPVPRSPTLAALARSIRHRAGMRIGRGAGGPAVRLAVLVVTLSCGAIAARAESAQLPSRGAAGPAVAPRIPAPRSDVPTIAWRWPLPGRPRVTRGFQPPQTAYGPGHRGVDLAGTIGQPVRAAGPGVVGFAGQFAGRGVVTVHHPGGLETTYEPVSAIVRSGAQVGPGDPLGRLEPGHPGCPVAACLHWGLRRGPVYLDPLSLVRAVRVRLLPLRE